MRALPAPSVTITFVGPEHATPIDRADKLTVDALKQGAFAVGTRGPAQDLDDKKVPADDVLSAVDRLPISTTVVIAPSTGPIEYRQVEVDPYHRRRPLPFVTEGALARRRQLGRAAQRLAATIPPLDGQSTLEVAAGLLSSRGGRSASDVAAWSGSRAAPPILGSLGEGLGRAARNATVTAVAPDPPALLPLRAPMVAAVLAAPVPDVVAEQLFVDRQGPARRPHFGREPDHGRPGAARPGRVRHPDQPPRLGRDARLAGAVPAAAPGTDRRQR
jgi:hypothetical protein